MLTRRTAIFTIISGGLITAFGYFTPFVVLGSCLATVGCGLIYTFNQSSSSATWIGYQALTGMALGMCFQTPVMAGQALSAQEDVPTTTAILMCKLTFHNYVSASNANPAQSSKQWVARFSFQLVSRCSPIS